MNASAAPWVKSTGVQYKGLKGEKQFDPMTFSIPSFPGPRVGPPPARAAHSVEVLHHSSAVMLFLSGLHFSPSKAISPPGGPAIHQSVCSTCDSTWVVKVRVYAGGGSVREGA